jgi:hypothetical protein
VKLELDVARERELLVRWVNKVDRITDMEEIIKKKKNQKGRRKQ